MERRSIRCKCSWTIARRCWLRLAFPKESADTFGENIRRMRERKLTFQEAIYPSLEFYLVEKSRLFRVRSELFEQLEQTPFA